MQFMLDTSICFELLRGRGQRVYARLRDFDADDISISSLTLAELQYGVAKTARPAHHQVLLAQFCAPLAILPFDNLAAEAYGEVRARLERAGTPIGALDTLIAAHALSRQLTVVTSNEREFRRVGGLGVENWLEK